MGSQAAAAVFGVADEAVSRAAACCHVEPAAPATSTAPPEQKLSDQHAASEACQPPPPPPPLTEKLLSELLYCSLGMQDFAQLCLVHASGTGTASSMEDSNPPEESSGNAAAAVSAAAAATAAVAAAAEVAAAAAETAAMRLAGTSVSAMAVLAVESQAGLAAAAAKARRSAAHGAGRALDLTERMLSAVASLWERPPHPAVLPSLVEVRRGLSSLWAVDGAAHCWPPCSDPVSCVSFPKICLVCCQAAHSITSVNRTVTIQSHATHLPAADN